MAARRRHELSLGQKLQLIKASGGRSQRQLTHQFNIGKKLNSRRFWSEKLSFYRHMKIIMMDLINVPGNKGNSKTLTISHGSGFSVFNHWTQWSVVSGPIMIQRRVKDYAKELRTFRLPTEFKNKTTSKLRPLGSPICGFYWEVPLHYLIFLFLKNGNVWGAAVLPLRWNFPSLKINQRNRDKNTAVLPGIDSKAIVVRRTDARWPQKIFWIWRIGCKKSELHVSLRIHNKLS